jgi:hypothetical protein
MASGPCKPSANASTLNPLAERLRRALMSTEDGAVAAAMFDHFAHQEGSPPAVAEDSQHLLPRACGHRCSAEVRCQLRPDLASQNISPIRRLHATFREKTCIRRERRLFRSRDQVRACMISAKCEPRCAAMRSCEMAFSASALTSCLVRESGLCAWCPIFFPSNLVLRARQ